MGPGRRGWEYLSTAISPPTNSCPSSFPHLSLSLSLSLSHTHIHTHTQTSRKERNPALRVQTPDPEHSSPQGCSPKLEGLRFPRGNPPALLPPASYRASGPHPGPKFPGSRPHPFLPARGGGRGAGGGGDSDCLPIPGCWCGRTAPSPPASLWPLVGSTPPPGCMKPPAAVVFELPLTDVRGRTCVLATQLRPTLCDPSQAPLSVGFSRQEYWRGWPLPPAGRGGMVASKASTPKPWIL